MSLAVLQNPNYFEEEHPSNMAPITGLAVEIWSVDGVSNGFALHLLSRMVDDISDLGAGTVAGFPSLLYRLLLRNSLHG